MTLNQWNAAMGEAHLPESPVSASTLRNRSADAGGEAVEWPYEYGLDCLLNGQERLDDGSTVTHTGVMRAVDGPRPWTVRLVRAEAIDLPPTGREECEARGYHEYRPLTTSLSWRGGVMVEMRCNCGAVKPEPAQ